MCFASSTKGTVRAPTVATMIAENTSSHNFTQKHCKAGVNIGECDGIFCEQRKTGRRQLETVSHGGRGENVQYDSLIAELNLLLATADSLTGLVREMFPDSEI